jgi:methylated-DNA-[protein]-cysteine S-methyltransferase
MKNKKIDIKFIYFSEYTSPLGKIFLAASEKGLWAITPSNGSQKSLPDNLTPQCFKLVRSEKPFKTLKGQMNKYFKGQPIVFKFKADLSHGTIFQRKVWGKLSELLPGQLVTYNMLARELGMPKSARAVGQAVGANPLPIIIPCHRVIASDGSLCGFGWGLKKKKQLLAIEGIHL